MTIKDQPYDDEAELELFLQGRGDLSHKLKALRQPVISSAAVDDAILAFIEADLAKEAAPAQAANDAVMPESAHAVRPRFMSLWRVPLGVAAGVLLTVLVQIYRQSEQPPVFVAEAPKTVELRMPIASPPEIVADAGKAPVPAASPKPEASPAHPLASKHEPAARAKAASAPIVIAQAEPQEVTVTGIRASLQQSLNVKRSAAQNVEVVTAEDVGKMPDKNVADSLQRVPGVTVSSTAEEAPPSALEIKRAARNNIDVTIAGNGRMADAPAPITAAPAPTITAASPAEETAKAQAWLALIAGKLKDGLNRDALDEWAKFRKAYPNYPVPESITEKIKALPTPENQPEK